MRPQVGVNLESGRVLAMSGHQHCKGPDTRRAGGARRCDPSELPVKRRRVIIEESQQQVLLMLEVFIERPLTHCGLATHIVDPEVVKSARCDASPCRVDQELATLCPDFRAKLGHPSPNPSVRISPASSADVGAPTKLRLRSGSASRWAN